MNDRDFMRYSRQLMLEEFGPQAQEKLAAAKVLIVGLGVAAHVPATYSGMYRFARHPPAFGGRAG